MIRNMLAGANEFVHGPSTSNQLIIDPRLSPHLRRYSAWKQRTGELFS